MAFLDNTGVARLVTDLKGKFATLVSGAVAVVQGGTGKTTHTTNAVLTGNGTNAVNNVATADGALYATAANGAAQFGTLPVAQGGTAGTTEAEARENLEVPVNAAIATVESTTATANHAIGDHFMLDDKLKTATAAIATGETINATNSADATVQAQIDTLRDSVVHKGSEVTTSFIAQPQSDSCISIYANGVAGPRSFTATEDGFRAYNNETSSDICRLQFVTPESSTASRRIEFLFKDGVSISLKFFQSTKELKVTTNIPGFTGEKVIATW